MQSWVWFDEVSTSSWRNDASGLWLLQYPSHSIREAQRLCDTVGTAVPPLPYKYTDTARAKKPPLVWPTRIQTDESSKPNNIVFIWLHIQEQKLSEEPNEGRLNWQMTNVPCCDFFVSVDFTVSSSTKIPGLFPLVGAVKRHGEPSFDCV